MWTDPYPTHDKYLMSRLRSLSDYFFPYFTFLRLIKIQTFMLSNWKENGNERRAKFYKRLLNKPYISNFERAKSIFKMLPVSWAESMLTSGSRPFQRGTEDLYMSKGFKVTSSQRWRLDKKFCHSARIEPDECGPGSSPSPYLSSSVFEGL